MSAIYRTREGDVLDWICWKHYRSQSGAVEAVLEANNGLADLGDVLPAGVEIVLPELSLPETDEFIRLWD